MQPRRAWAEIKFEGKTMRADVTDTITGASVTLVADGESDTMSFTATDRDGKWLNEYYPKIKVGSNE